MVKSSPHYYQLTKIQVAILRDLASGEGVYTIVKPDDKSNQIVKDDWKLTQDLFDLGLLEDVSKQLNKEQIARMTAAVPKGRDYVIIVATKMGQLMFDYCDDPECTAHKKRLPC